jgi:hypothetical protein
MKSNLLWGVVFAVISIVSLAICQYRDNSTKDYSIARITRDGVVIKEIDLNKVKEAYEFVITSPSGESNTVSVQKGKIGITEADCRDKICVNTGYISTGAVPIVCLPHKLSIAIVDNSQIDAVAGNH